MKSGASRFSKRRFETDDYEEWFYPSLLFSPFFPFLFLVVPPFPPFLSFIIIIIIVIPLLDNDGVYVSFDLGLFLGTGVIRYWSMFIIRVIRFLHFSLLIMDYGISRE